MIQVRSKVKEDDIEATVREIESIIEPTSIYPKILELPKQTKEKNKRGPYRASYDSLTKEFTIQSEQF